jgi:hypothetical protein
VEAIAAIPADGVTWLGAFTTHASSSDRQPSSQLDKEVRNTSSDTWPYADN